jgi:hypothetical protein
MSNAEIAHMKPEARDRAQLIVIAYESGLVARSHRHP